MPEEARKRLKSKNGKRPSERGRRKGLPPKSLLDDEMQAYSQADLTRLFRLPARLLGALARAHYITAPAPHGKTNYTFQDLLILRTASALKAAKISTPQITAALGNLRASLPPGAMLTTLALAASGKDLLVQEGTTAWEAGSRQYALPLKDATRASVTVLGSSTAPNSSHQEAETLYARGHALEESDLAAARAAYAAALKLRRDHLEARINLGRLLHLAGELREAEKVYRAARHSSALLSFNLAILLEDLHREKEAIKAYREALALDPSLHDAHFNLSLLHERANEPRDALRHLLAYKRQIFRQGQRD
jgi:tetratricopeptide (TPR) repeat protein